MKKILFIVLTLAILFFLVFYLKEKAFQKPVSFLSYSDLVKLSKDEYTNKSLKLKLEKQLNGPYIVNRAPSSELRAQVIRVAHWNIERGLRVDAIKNIFSNRFNYLYTYKNNIDLNRQKDFKKELNNFVRSDIISLNEVDVGIPRTKYKNIVKELAQVLNYNYVFVTEFVELSPVLYGPKVNRFLYRGLHGNAILSKYLIKDVKVIRLPECYKWFEAELRRKSPLEHARRAGAKVVFSEKVITEVRRGGRNAIVADIELPNKEILTFVSTHLEDRCYPSCRLKQMEVLLDNLKYVRTPLVLAGDLNTTSTDSAPTSVQKEITKRLRDPHFILRQIAFAAVPGVPVVAGFGSVALSKLFQYNDPSAHSFPVLFPNEERKLFNFLRDFRFSDGEGFDFSGDSLKSSNGKSGFLSNSNERQFKGFESTFRFEEPRLIAYFKLDWFFVKPKNMRFRPFNGQTLKLLNEAYPGRISDHDPITVDLSI